MNTDSKEKKPRSKALIILTVFLLIVALLWGLYWLFVLRFYETTDDAYANGNLIYINSPVPGSVIAFYADDTDLVEEGQLIAELDCIPYSIAYERELATLGSIVLQVRELFDNVLVNEANVKAKKIALQRAFYDYRNRKELVTTKAVSEEEYVHSKDDLLTADFGLKLANFQLQAAESLAGNTTLTEHPLIQEQRAKVKVAYYNFRHCKIYAPQTGHVAERSLQVGMWVTPTTDLLAIIPSDYVWVDANFKETQLTSMRIGQSASVWFDIYGSHVEFKGKVLGIASGTGSVFSIIPPQNATGNWIKIVQRLAVRISLDPDSVKKYPMRLGLSCQVDVDISNLNLPFLADVPSKRSVGSTKVFDLDLDVVEKTMEEVISRNLK